MNCRTIVDSLMEYLDGSLSADQRKAFETHLKICAPCLRYLESYRRTVEIEEALRRCEEKEGSFPLELFQMILSARRSRS